MPAPATNSWTLRLTRTAAGPSPLEVRVHADGAVELAGDARLEPGASVQLAGWTVELETAEPAGPELLIILPADPAGKADHAKRMRCPLPDAVGACVLLGRSRRACDIAVHDDHVSRVHVKLIRTENGFAAEDMHSKWGTLFNGRPMRERTLLGHGDELRIGASVVRFLTRWDAKAARPPRPIKPAAEELFESAGTRAVAPPESRRPERHRSTDAGELPSARSLSRPVTRTAVPTLWIGIGIGMMIAVVGIVVWTLVAWLWPKV